jgi:two-component system sensor histidine kinase/response regulator
LYSAIYQAEIVSNSQFFIIKRIVSHQVYLQLRGLWLETATIADEKALSITETSLLTVKRFDLQIQPEWDVNSPTSIAKFSLLITPHFQALFWVDREIVDKYYQINVTFEEAAIVTYLNWLSQQSDYSKSGLSQLIKSLENRTTESCDYFHIFATKIINLLASDSKQHDTIFQNQQTPPVEKFLQEQIAKQQVLGRIKAQVERQIDLSTIIQMAIEQSCHLLAVDRVAIYQFNSDFAATENSAELACATVTYEARANNEIKSILYFREETCLKYDSRWHNKYRQGFGLVIDDTEVDLSSTPCLQGLMQKLQVRAKLIAPINVQGKLWGLIIAHQCLLPRHWQRQEIEFLRQIAESLAIAIYRDCSYQKLQQQKQILEKQVREQAQQIKEALIAAQAANQSKHQFIGSMSHELRTPLTCVIGLSGTLLNWSKNNQKIPLSIEKQQQYLKLIQDSGKHLLTLINQILEFSELESGKYFLNLSEFSLNHLLAEILKEQQNIARQKQITLTLESELISSSDLFLADRERLGEILVNLIENGIKFTPNGGEVIVRTWRNSHHLVLQIEDTGIGISEAEIPLLFEKFQQLENFRQRTHGGTGLGLALTKQLVELHGGTIEVESLVGKGSTFTVYLPGTKNVSHKIKPKIEFASQLLLKTKVVMLITEDEDRAGYICQLLTTTGYKVVWSIDSTTARIQIELLKPDILIIDRDCSDNIVDEIIRDINTLHTNRPQTLLFCRHLTDSDWSYFAQHGVNDYLLKSMNSQQILEKIDLAIISDNHFQPKPSLDPLH